MRYRTGMIAGRERRWQDPRAAVPWLVMLCYLVGAVAVTSKLWADPASREQYSGVGDNELFAWFVRYAATAVSHGQLPALVTTGMNAPVGINLMWNTSFLLPGVLLTPVTLLAGPQVSLTVASTLGFAGSAAALYWVLRRWGASLGAAALGGAVYGFSPAMVNAGFAHYHLQFAVLPPLIADAVLRLVTGRGHRVRTPVWLGLLCAAQLFVGEELLVYTVLTCAIVTVLAAVSRPVLVPERVRGAVEGAVFAAAVFLVVDGYALWTQYFGPLAEHSKLLASATQDPAWYVTPNAQLLFHTTASAAATPLVIPGTAEDLVYLGWPLLIVTVIALVAFWRDLRVRIAGVTWLVLESFTLGGADLHAGRYTWSGRLLPWHWLQGLPGLAQVLPWRFSILADGAAAAVLVFALDLALARATRDWVRGALAGIALVAVLPLVPLPYQVATLTPLPAGWQATAAQLRLPADSPVLILPFPGASLPYQPLRWQADTGWPRSMIGGYFLGPGPTGQASFYFSYPSPQTAVASYLDALWAGEQTASPPASEIQSVFDYWRPGAIVAVAGPGSPIVTELTRLFGRPTYHLGQVFSWRTVSRWR
jgi:hypothetical protein